VENVTCLGNMLNEIITINNSWPV